MDTNEEIYYDAFDLEIYESLTNLKGENMIDQHRNIIESDLTDKQKIAELFEVCGHLYTVLDKIQASHQEMTYLESVCDRRTEDGFYLKVEQSGNEYKATFWKPHGDGVETYSHRSESLVDAIERAGTKAGSQVAIKILRQGYDALGIDLAAETRSA